MKKISLNNIFDQLIYVRLTESCNMKCKHCFIPSNPKKMTLNDCMMIPDVVKKVAAIGDRVILQWHGGEPTLYGVSRLRRVIKNLNSECSDFSLIHGIQTNLLNYNSDWAMLYHDYFDSRIGVSWDYKIRESKNGDFNSIFMQNIDNLHKDAIKFDLTITTTKLFYDWVMSSPSEFFSFLERVKPSSLHLEKLTKTGEARNNWEEIGLNNLQYSELLSLIYLYFSNWIEINNEWFDGISPLRILKVIFNHLFTKNP